MKRLLLVLVASIAYGQNKVTIIPSGTGTGELRFQDKSTPPKYLIFKTKTPLAATVTWELPNADAAGCLQSNGLGVLSIGSCSATSGLPVVDSTNIVKGSADATKLLKFEVDGFTTATTRTLTPQDASYIIAAKDMDNVFSTNQTFKDVLCFTDNGCNIGTNADRFNTLAVHNIDSAPPGDFNAYTMVNHLAIVDHLNGGAGIGTPSAFWDFLANAAGSASSALIIQDNSGATVLELNRAAGALIFNEARLDMNLVPSQSSIPPFPSVNSHWSLGIPTKWWNQLYVIGLNVDIVNTDLIPTGHVPNLTLGNGSNRWDGAFRNVDISGTCTGCSGAPFSDASYLFYNGADSTKRAALSLAGIATGTTRTLTLQNASYTIAGTNIDNNFTSDQTFQNLLAFRSANDLYLKANKLVVNYQASASSFQFQMGTTNQLNLYDNAGSLMTRWDSSIAPGLVSFLGRDVQSIRNLTITGTCTGCGNSLLAANNTWTGTNTWNNTATFNGPAGANQQIFMNAASGFGSFLTFGPASGQYVEFSASSIGDWSVTHFGIAAGVFNSIRSGAVSNTLVLQGGDATFGGNLNAFNAGNIEYVKANKLVFNYSNTAANFQWTMSGTNTARLLDNSGLPILQFDTSLSNYMSLAGNFIPNANITYDIGASSFRWNKLWIKDIDISGTCTGAACGAGAAATFEINIMSYGGDNTGAGNNDTAYAAAKVALAASPGSTGGCILFPRGIYTFLDTVKLGNGTNTSQSTQFSPCIKGAGSQVTYIKRRNATLCYAPRSISSISSGATAIVTTSGSHGMYDGQLVSLSSSSGLTIPAGSFITNLAVKFISSTQFSLQALDGTAIAGPGGYGGGSTATSLAPGDCAVMAIMGPVENAVVRDLTLDANGAARNGLDVGHGNKADIKNVTVTNWINKAFYFTGVSSPALSGVGYGNCLMTVDHIFGTVPFGSNASGIWVDGLRTSGGGDTCSATFNSAWSEYSGGAGTFGILVGFADSVIFDMVGGYPTSGGAGYDFYFQPSVSSGFPANIYMKHAVVAQGGFGGAAGPSTSGGTYATVVVGPYANESCSGGFNSKCDPGSLLNVSGFDYSNRWSGNQNRMVKQFTIGGVASGSTPAWGVYKQDMQLVLESTGSRVIGQGGGIGFGDATTFNYAAIKGGATNSTAGQYGGYLAFATTGSGSGGGTNGYERMRLDQDGNLTLWDGVITINTSTAYNSIQSIHGGIYTLLGYTTDQAIYPRTYASSASLFAPAAGYGGIGHNSGSNYWYWNGSAWATVNLAATGGVSLSGTNTWTGTNTFNNVVTATAGVDTQGGFFLYNGATVTATLSAGGGLQINDFSTGAARASITGAGIYKGPSGNPGLSTTIACSGGQAIKSIAVSGGIVTSLACGVP